MNNQKHLTPEQVQELMNFGVEFEETACIWAESIGHPLWDDNGEPYYIGDGCHTLYLRNSNDNDVWFEPTILPAPNFQEVLEILPTSIKQRCLTGEQEVVSYILSIQRRFSISNGSDSAFAMEYVYNPDDPFEMCTMRCFSDTNPLIAAYDLLMWVINFYPESLIKTEKK